jgi:hypothetical protein
MQQGEVPQVEELNLQLVAGRASRISDDGARARIEKS